MTATARIESLFSGSGRNGASSSSICRAVLPSAPAMMAATSGRAANGAILETAVKDSFPFLSADNSSGHMTVARAA